MSLATCNNNHDDIAYWGHKAGTWTAINCPLCDAIDKINELQQEVDEWRQADMNAGEQ